MWVCIGVYVLANMRVRSGVSANQCVQIYVNMYVYICIDEQY
jgi:hypothetical protein